MREVLLVGDIRQQHLPCFSGFKSVAGQFNIGRFPEVKRVLVDTITDTVDDPVYTGIDQRFRAVYARKVGYITGGITGGNTMQRSLDDRIRFRMDRANAVTVYH